MENELQYDILANEDVDVLIVNVNVAMRQGWTPQGGVSVTKAPAEFGNGDLLLFCQAMVKTKQTDDQSK